MPTQEGQRGIELSIGDGAGHRATRNIKIEIARHKDIGFARRSPDLGEHLDELVAPELVVASTFEVRVISYQRSAMDSDLTYQRYPRAQPSLEGLERRDKPPRVPEPRLATES